MTKRCRKMTFEYISPDIADFSAAYSFDEARLRPWTGLFETLDLPAIIIIYNKVCQVNVTIFALYYNERRCLERD